MREEGKSGRGADEFKATLTFKPCFEAMCDSRVPTREESEVIPGSGTAWPTRIFVACHRTWLRSQQCGVCEKKKGEKLNWRI